MDSSPRLAEPPCPIAPFVPQSQGMCLLDDILAVDDDSLQAEVTPNAESLFVTGAGIPAWVGLEWLAQAVAAWAGWHARPHHEQACKAPPAIGFLIGSKRFESLYEHLAIHRTYRVSIHLDFRADNGLGHFHGEILNNDSTRLAHGTLTVFQPPSSEQPEQAFDKEPSP